MAEFATVDNIIFAGAHNADAGTCVLAGLAAAATYARGTILGRNKDGKYIILDTPASSNTNTAEFILAQDTLVGTSDTVAEVYRSGDFVEDYLTVADGYTITDADRINLKNAGIYLKNGVTV